MHETRLELGAIHITKLNALANQEVTCNCYAKSEEVWSAYLNPGKKIRDLPGGCSGDRRRVMAHSYIRHGYEGCAFAGVPER